MENCVSCGHALGVGRFCVNCGHPVGAPPATDDDWRTGTAERPAVTPAEPGRVPPPPVPPPPVPPDPVGGPRYPLFADEVSPTPSWEPPRGHRQHRGPRRWVPWAVGFVVLALVASVGVWLLTSDDEPAGRAVEPSRSASPTTGESPTASDSATSPDPGTPENVARLATATVPATAPPNQDLDGNSVRYEARNMLDGVPETTWRMPGDGTGAEISFALAAPTRLTEVGLINGYAKTATDARGKQLDWYHGNRRVLAVEWVFDDGSTVTQSLDDTRGVQNIEIDPVTTSTVVLRLVSVSPPGSGRAARDYTAISDVTLVGTTA